MVLEDFGILSPAEVLVDRHEVNATSHDYIALVIGNWLSDYNRVYLTSPSLLFIICGLWCWGLPFLFGRTIILMFGTLYISLYGLLGLVRAWIVDMLNLDSFWNEVFLIFLRGVGRVLLVNTIVDLLLFSPIEECIGIAIFVIWVMLGEAVWREGYGLDWLFPHELFMRKGAAISLFVIWFRSFAIVHSIPNQIILNILGDIKSTPLTYHPNSPLFIPPPPLHPSRKSLDYKLLSYNTCNSSRTWAEVPSEAPSQQPLRPNKTTSPPSNSSTPLLTQRLEGKTLLEERFGEG